MIQKWDFQELDLKGAYSIKPFFASDERGGLIKDYKSMILWSENHTRFTTLDFSLAGA